MIYTTTDVSEGELLGEYIGVFRDCGELDKVKSINHNETK